MTALETSAFTHTLREVDGRTMIASTCNECGASNVMPVADRSLEAWEDRHAAQHETVNSGLA